MRRNVLDFVRVLAAKDGAGRRVRHVVSQPKKSVLDPERLVWSNTVEHRCNIGQGLDVHLMQRLVHQGGMDNINQVIHDFGPTYDFDDLGAEAKHVSRELHHEGVKRDIVAAHGRLDQAWRVDDVELAVQDGQSVDGQATPLATNR